GVALVGIISCRHHPIFWVLRHSDEFIVGMSSARTEDRYDPHAGGDQEFAHGNPPCDFDAGDDPQWNEEGQPFHSYEEHLRQFPKSGAGSLVTKKSILTTSLSQVKTLSPWS